MLVHHFKRLRAVRSLRLNYTRRGCWQWLLGRGASTGLRGWQIIWRYPEQVEAEQQAMADGVFL